MLDDIGTGTGREDVFVQTAMSNFPDAIKGVKNGTSTATSNAPFDAQHLLQKALTAMKKIEQQQPQASISEHHDSYLHIACTDQGQYTASIRVLDPTAIPQTLPIGQAPPYLRMPHPPNVKITAALFGLDTEQLLPFTLLAHHLLHDPYCQQEPPLQMALMGSAGTGKSKVLEAFLWFAFQNNLSNAVVVVSYTWRAVLHLSTQHNMGCSTTTFFGIDCINNDLRLNQTAMERLSESLHAGVAFILNDEVSFDNCHHFGSISRATQLATVGRYKEMPFGRFNVVHTGDFMQHAPIQGAPLYSTPPTTSNLLVGRRNTQADAIGREAWRSLSDVVILKQQHRFSNTPDGQQLRNLINKLFDPMLAKEQVRTMLLVTFV
jgi:hypothetical protein